jgi:hypothetical protein
MQKTNIKASILIWATFLSLIITITFISISTNINKNLKNNSSLINQFKLNNQIENIINSWSLDYNYKNQYLDNWDKIIFEPANKHIQTLRKLETILWKVNVDSNISIKVLNWWAVFYKQNTSSWLIIKWTPNTFSNDWTWTFSITNLWWISQIQITSDSFKNYLWKYREYTIYKTIWNKEIIKTTWKIKSF